MFRKTYLSRTIQDEVQSDIIMIVHRERLVGKRARYLTRSLSALPSQLFLNVKTF